VAYSAFAVTGVARLLYFPEKAGILCGGKFLERKNIPSWRSIKSQFMSGLLRVNTAACV